MNNLKQVVFLPSKQKTKDFYLSHIIGTSTSYRYIVKTQILQVVLTGETVRQFRVPMTYEDFEREIKIIHKITLIKSFGLN